MIQAVNCNVFLYADDSALVISVSNPKEIEHRLGLELQLVSVWLEENKLSLHLCKTENILFASKIKAR